MSNKVAAIILNYNSIEDLKVCVEKIFQQNNVNLTLIVVDNASRPEVVSEIGIWLSESYSDVTSVNVSEVFDQIDKDIDLYQNSKNIYFIKNNINNGYSAGNNIGARLAIKLGCETLLIINPDVQINNHNYLSEMDSKLTIDDRYVVAASAIKNLSGVNENPMQELGYFEEFFWPFWMVFSRFGLKPPSQRKRLLGKCKKVSGCCLLIKASFLKSIGFFDEGVFLYCEEAILAAQINNAGKEILYVPELEALHAHKTSEKGNRIKRLTEWVKSRKYYHRHYTNYGPIRRFLLSVSHQFLLQIIRIQDAFKTTL